MLKRKLGDLSNSPIAKSNVLRFSNSSNRNQTSSSSSDLSTVVSFSDSTKKTRTEASVEQNNIHEVHHFHDIARYITDGSLILLDLDNTVMETTSTLGSDQWFVKFLTENLTKFTDAKNAHEHSVHVYNKVHVLAKTKAVEPGIPEIIRLWQEQGKTVLGLTARGNTIANDTIRQLQEIGISFNHGLYKDQIVKLSQGTESILKAGIIFCGGAHKGRCLEELLENMAHAPEHAVCVDDKHHNLLHVQEKATRFPSGFTGLRYTHLDAKVKDVNMRVAAKQLELTGRLLTDEEAEALLELDARHASRPVLRFGGM